jgi:toxin ParE1/3/4
MANKPIEFDSEAADEVVDGYEWYLKRSPQAARAFLSEVDRAIDAIQASPAMFATYLHGTRRYLLKRYPYAIVYRELPELIQIVAVSHLKRRPGYWKSRV